MANPTNLYDFYQSQGQVLPSVQERSKTYEQYGLGPATNYRGTAEQNTQLLQRLAGGVVPQPAPQPAPAGNYQTPVPAPTAQPAPQPQPQATQPAGGSREQQLISAMTQKGHTVETAKAAIAGRGVDDLAREYLGGPSGGGGGIQQPVFQQPQIDLPSLYANLFKTSEIPQYETQISEKTDQLSGLESEYLKARDEVADNPFLSAGVVSQRLARVRREYEIATQPLKDEVAKIQGQIATKKADIETQLNLQTKQFDINSQQAQMAFNQLNTLLGSGALDSASGEDIANLTRATGVSSSMIYSAIEAQKKKNAPQPQMVSYDDGNTQGFVLVNPETGEILNRQSVASSKPSAAKEPKAASETEMKSYYQNNLRNDAAAGLTLDQIFQLYTGYLDPNQILTLYNTNSIYGPAKEKLKDLEKYGVKK